MTPYDWRCYLSWDGRIGRREYVVGQQVLGIAGFFAGLVLFVASLFWTSLLTGYFIFVPFLALVAALSIPGSSLLVRRAHDLGWPAVVSMAAMLLPLMVVLALFARFGIVGPEAAKAQWLDDLTSTPLVLVAFAFSGVVSFWLMFKEGQPEENRYGPAPL